MIPYDPFWLLWYFDYQVNLKLLIPFLQTRKLCKKEYGMQFVRFKDLLNFKKKKIIKNQKSKIMIHDSCYTYLFNGNLCNTKYFHFHTNKIPNPSNQFVK